MIWHITGFVLAVGAIVAFSLPEMVKKKQSVDIVVFSSLLLISVVISGLLLTGVEVPTPLHGITKILEPVNKWIESLLS